MGLKRAARITLEFIDSKYKWIARNRDLTVNIFVNEPIKTDDEWIDPTHPHMQINDPNQFDSITWEQPQATNIDSLLDGR